MIRFIHTAGDAAVKTDMVSAAIYVHSGTDPFAVVADAVR
jgi:hypothetical protein